MKVKKKNLTRLASLSALGAGAVGVGAKNAHAGIVYTNFSPPTITVGFSAASATYINPVANLGLGGFGLFRTGIYFPPSYTSRRFSVSAILKIVLQGLDGLKFQSAPGPGFIWNNTAPAFTYKTIRSKRTRYSAFLTPQTFTPNTNGLPVTTTHLVLKTGYNSTILQDRQGDFYMMFSFNPTGTQDLFGWVHFQGLCNCGLDTVLVDMAYDDTGATIQAGASPEPGTFIPTGFAALALGATGIRRWRKQRKQAA